MKSVMFFLVLLAITAGAAKAEVVTATIKVTGSGRVIEGRDFDLAGKAIGAMTITDADDITIRDCTFHGFQKGPGGNNAVLYVARAKRVLIENCRFYDNGSIEPAESYERDVHGILIGPDCEAITVKECVSWNNAGDSIQVSYYSAAPAQPAKDIKIVGNVFFADGENAIDLKGCDGVLIENNVIRDYSGPSKGSDGTGIGVHYDRIPARNVVIRGNDIYNCSDNAITVSGGVDAVTIDRNTFSKCGVAINAWQMKAMTITGNVIEGCPGGVKLSGGTTLTHGDNVFGPGCDFTIDPAKYNNTADIPLSNIFVGVTAEYGDVNLDGSIDHEDLSVLLKNIFRPGGWRQGDINGDLLVDGDDFQIINSSGNQ